MEKNRAALDHEDVKRAIGRALLESYIWHGRTTFPLQNMRPDVLRGQAWRNVLDLLRPAHVVRQQIMAGRRLAPDELRPYLAPSPSLDEIGARLVAYDSGRLRDALEVAERERVNVRYARAIAERHGVSEGELLMRYIRDQEEFFGRVVEAARRLLRSRQNRV